MCVFSIKRRLILQSLRYISHTHGATLLCVSTKMKGTLGYVCICMCVWMYVCMYVYHDECIVITLTCKHIYIYISISMCVCVH